MGILIRPCHFDVATIKPHGPKLLAASYCSHALAIMALTEFLNGKISPTLLADIDRSQPAFLLLLLDAPCPPSSHPPTIFFLLPCTEGERTLRRRPIPDPRPAAGQAGSAEGRARRRPTLGIRTAHKTRYGGSAVRRGAARRDGCVVLTCRAASCHAAIPFRCCRLPRDFARVLRYRYRIPCCLPLAIVVTHTTYPTSRNDFSFSHPLVAAIHTFSHAPLPLFSRHTARCRT